MATKDKNIWLLLIFILAGIVIGGVIGELTKGINWLWWLSYGLDFGITDPLSLDLHILKLSFGLMVRINIASIIGIGMSIWLYRRA